MLRNCKVCFNKFEYRGINFLKKNFCLCSSCFNSFDVRFHKIRVNKVKTLIIYNYNDFFREQLYLFKGCKDIELGGIFLSNFIRELKIRYRGFYMVPIPSTKRSDEERGFNHVVEIFKVLDIPIIKCLSKKEEFKQTKSSKSKRERALSLFEIDKKSDLKGKKILIVDDVVTTKTSLKAAISLIDRASPKKIEALILSKKF